MVNVIELASGYPAPSLSLRSISSSTNECPRVSRCVGIRDARINFSRFAYGSSMGNCAMTLLGGIRGFHRTTRSSVRWRRRAFSNVSIHRPHQMNCSRDKLQRKQIDPATQRAMGWIPNADGCVAPALVRSRNKWGESDTRISSRCINLLICKEIKASQFVAVLLHFTSVPGTPATTTTR